MMKCLMEFVGVLHFLGLFFVCVTLTWCTVDGLLVSTAFFFFFVTSCYQEDLKRSRMLWWDFPESSFKRAAILWPLPKTCPKVIFLLQHQFICLSYPFQLSSSVCLLRFGTIVVLYWWRLFVALPESAQKEEWGRECFSRDLGGTLLIFWCRRKSWTF